MHNHVFVGFGFGPIQAGLFLYEAFQTGKFQRLVVAEVAPETVAAVRRNQGQYALNVATPTGLKPCRIQGIEMLNPQVPDDRARLVAAVRDATEIATALPSVTFFDDDSPASVAAILADGLRRKARDRAARAVIYTAENHNRAAEILEQVLARRLAKDAALVREWCHPLNTVIGKMSGIVADPRQIAEQRLAPMTPDLARCFLVEEFNRILITRIRWPDFQRALAVFQEKADLLPFEEAKLYGHNAAHALIGYLAHHQGYVDMAQAGADRRIMAVARRAFLEESGGALCARYAGVDPLFTATGFQAYVDDLLVRMTNPHLRDAVARIIRDPRRKLGWDDRLVGTMRLALQYRIEPHRYALGAAAALALLAEQENRSPGTLLAQIWDPTAMSSPEAESVQRLIAAADAARKEDRL